jgi:hypothetical protein
VGSRVILVDFEQGAVESSFLAPTSQYKGEVILTCFPPESMQDLTVWHGRCDSHEEFVPMSPTKWPLSGIQHLPWLVGAFTASPISWLRK